MTFLFFSGDFPVHPAREAGYDVLGHPQQGRQTGLQKVHAGDNLFGNNQCFGSGSAYFQAAGSVSTGKERQLIKGNFVRQSAKEGHLEGNSGPLVDVGQIFFWNKKVKKMKVFNLQ